jgi:hypothetical protein|tara:strand:- start:729 stop:869 length:141 start_codon:yes stop_codon:yes gene_type:complete
LEEFIEIRVGDGEELESIKKREVFSQSFIEYALIELQPGEFAIDEG